MDSGYWLWIVLLFRAALMLGFCVSVSSQGLRRVESRSDVNITNKRREHQPGPAGRCNVLLTFRRLRTDLQD